MNRIAGNTVHFPMPIGRWRGVLAGIQGPESKPSPGVVFELAA